MQETGLSRPDTAPHPDVMVIRLDGRGGARTVDPAGEGAMAPPEEGDGFLWAHIRLGAAETPERLKAAGLDDFVIDALLADETRPRCTVHGDGVIVNLRGVNLQAGADVEDMISVRLWLTATRVIGVWRRPLTATADLLASIERGRGPVSPGDFISRFVLRLADRAEPAVADLNELVDDLEEALLERQPEIERSKLSSIRRTAIILRRYLMPQRDALTTLEIEDLDWLSERDRSHLREAAERIYRLGEDLDSIRDRTQIISEQIMDARAERLNDRMLILSIVAAIFLPLSLLTGLLGINVDGIPGAENPGAFWVVCLILLVLGVLLFLIARRLGMFR